MALGAQNVSCVAGDIIFYHYINYNLIICTMTDNIDVHSFKIFVISVDTSLNCKLFCDLYNVYSHLANPPQLRWQFKYHVENSLLIFCMFNFGFPTKYYGQDSPGRKDE